MRRGRWGRRRRWRRWRWRTRRRRVGRSRRRRRLEREEITHRRCETRLPMLPMLRDVPMSRRDDGTPYSLGVEHKLQQAEISLGSSERVTHKQAI